MTYSNMYRTHRVLRRSQTVGTYELTRRRGFGPITNALFLAAVLAVMGLIYLTQITKTSVFGFEVSELKEQKKTLEQTNQSLRIEAARLQAIERIKSSEVAGSLTDVDKLTFAEGQDANTQ